jgi:hypothetical protein
VLKIEIYDKDIESILVFLDMVMEAIHIKTKSASLENWVVIEHEKGAERGGVREENLVGKRRKKIAEKVEQKHK